MADIPHVAGTVSSRGNLRPPLERVTTSQALVKAITRQVLDGTLEGGEHLREIEMAEGLGVSRQSLRAALLELVHLGLLRRESHRGVFVSKLSADDIRDLYDVRELIEIEAARRLTAAPEKWPQLEAPIEQLERLQEAAAWSAIVEGDFAVHRALVATTGSARLMYAHEVLCSESRLALVRAQHFWTPAYMAAEHRELFEVICGGDPEAAAQRVRGHLRMGLERILDERTSAEPAPPR